MNLKTYTLVTAPATEPVSVAEVKAFCKIEEEDTSEDDLLESLIRTARRACEEHTKRACITQTWKMVMDRFYDYQGDPDGLTALSYLCGDNAIGLSREPVQSITSIKMTDTVNAQTTVDPATYTLDAAGGRILLNLGYSWPTDLRDFAAVEVTYACGYGDAEDVPDPIKQAILLFVAAMYENRQCVTLPEGAKSLLAPFCSAQAFGAF